jgi:hypothetical protein
LADRVVCSVTKKIESVSCNHFRCRLRAYLCGSRAARKKKPRRVARWSPRRKGGCEELEILEDDEDVIALPMDL